MARAKRKTGGRKTGVLKLYESYMFRGKDPAIDEFRTIAQDHYGKRNLSGEDYADIEEHGGPSRGCVKSWLEGKTRRPQNATLEAAGRAIGYERKWVKQSTKTNGNGK